MTFPRKLKQNQTPVSRLQLHVCHRPAKNWGWGLRTPYLKSQLPLQVSDLPGLGNLKPFQLCLAGRVLRDREVRSQPEIHKAWPSRLGGPRPFLSPSRVHAMGAVHPQATSEYLPIPLRSQPWTSGSRMIFGFSRQVSRQDFRISPVTCRDSGLPT